MKIKVEKVSVLSTKMFSSLSFSFIFLRKLGIYSSCDIVWVLLGLVFLGLGGEGGTCLIHWRVFWGGLVFWFCFSNKCNTFDCSLRNVSLLKQLYRMSICLIKNRQLLIALCLQEKKGKYALTKKEICLVSNNFTPKKVNPLSIQIT